MGIDVSGRQGSHGSGYYRTHTGEYAYDRSGRVFLDYLFLCKAGEGQSARFADAVLCFLVGDCLQSGVFYFWLVTDLSGRCVYHDYYHADCNHDFSGSFPERTRYSEKGDWDISWVHRCPDLDSEQPGRRYGRWQRMGGRPLYGSSD